MFVFLGLVTIFLMTFGTYFISGGNIAVLLSALPIEFAMIGGSAVGAFVIGNRITIIKSLNKDLAYCLRGARWKKEDYRNLLCLLYEIIKMIQIKGLLSIESHIENHEESELFDKYPKIASDPIFIPMLCDTIRLITFHVDNPYQIEELFEKRLGNIQIESTESAAALSVTADALPALGIVAAVLGVIKTMASADQPPEVLGLMIASALTGTFLGVFMSYCIVSPIAQRLRNLKMLDMNFYYITRDTIIAYLKTGTAQLAVECGRNSIPSNLRPTFEDLDKAIHQVGSKKIDEEEKEVGES